MELLKLFICHEYLILVLFNFNNRRNILHFLNILLKLCFVKSFKPTLRKSSNGWWVRLLLATFSCWVLPCPCPGIIIINNKGTSLTELVSLLLSCRIFLQDFDQIMRTIVFRKFIFNVNQCFAYLLSAPNFRLFGFLHVSCTGTKRFPDVLASSESGERRELPLPRRFQVKLTTKSMYQLPLKFRLMARTTNKEGLQSSCVRAIANNFVNHSPNCHCCLSTKWIPVS